MSCKVSNTPSVKPTLTLGGCLYLTKSNKEVSTSASTGTPRQGNATTFEQNKQMSLSTLTRIGFSNEVCSHLRLA